MGASKKHIASYSCFRPRTILIIVLILSSLCIGATLGPYYVDVTGGNDATGDGTNPDTPYKSISPALDLAEDTAGTNDYIVYVLTGTYTESSYSNILDFEANADNDQIQIIGVTSFTNPESNYADGSQVTVSCSSTTCCFSMSGLVGATGVGTLTVKNIRFETPAAVDSDYGALKKSAVASDNVNTFINCQFARVNAGACTTVWGELIGQGDTWIFQNCEFISSNSTATAQNMLVGSSGGGVPKIEFDSCTIGTTEDASSFIQCRGDEVLFHNNFVQSRIFVDPYSICAEINNNVWDTVGRSCILLGSNPAYPTTITGITDATPPVVTTSAAHGLTNGLRVRITGVAGMTEINCDGNDEYYLVANKTADTFEVTDRFGNNLQDGSLTAYTSGGTVQPIYHTDRDAKFEVYNNYFDGDSATAIGSRGRFIDAGDVRGLFIYGNNVKNGGVQTISLVNCDGALVMNNYLEGQDCVTLRASNYCHVVNNTLMAQQGACIWWTWSGGDTRGEFVTGTTVVNNKMVTAGLYDGSGDGNGYRGPLFFNGKAYAGETGTTANSTNHFIDYNSYWNTDTVNTANLALINSVECATIAEVIAQWVNYMILSDVGYDAHSTAGTSGKGLPTTVNTSGGGINQSDTGVSYENDVTQSRLQGRL